MPSNPVVWFEIYVQDMARAKRFYEAVFDIKLEKMPAPTPDITMEMWAFPSDPSQSPSQYGACGMLVKMDGYPTGGGGTVVYFACKDCALEAARVAANGGVLIKEKMSLGPHGFMALARDTEGNMIGLHSM